MGASELAVSQAIRVLLVGPRRGLSAVLVEDRIPHVVWTDVERPYPHADHVHVAPIPAGSAAARRAAQSLAPHGPFSHVLAGTEAAVVPAAIARRTLGARMSSQSTVLRCHDKLRMKQHLSARGIRTTPFLDARTAGAAASVIAALGRPVVSKPRTLSGGRGLELIPDAASLAALPRRGRIFERWVDAPEISVESFVDDGRVLFENVTEYARKEHVNVVPGDLDPHAREEILKLNRRILGALAIQWGMTHLEIYRTAAGPLFGEIALRPPGGYIMELLRLAWGFDPWAAFLAVELGRPFAFPGAPSAHAAAVVLHPGEGRVTALHGVEEIRSRPEVVDLRVRVRPGDRVERRAGVGEDVGRVLLRTDTHPALLGGIAAVEDRLRIEVG